MRVKESNLRRLIRKQLREQGAEAAYSGAKKSDLTGQEKRQMKNAISAAVGQGLADEKIATADDTWSLRVRVGRDGRWRVKQLSDNLKHRKREVLRIVSRAVNQEEVQEFTDKLAGWGRRLTVTINDPESPQSPAITEEDPTPPSPKPRRPKKKEEDEDEFLYDPDECVKKQQRALGVDDDGLWGPNTQKAWDKKYPKQKPPTNSSDLPACKPEEEEDEVEKKYKCPPGTEQGDCPDGTYEDEDYQGNKSCVPCEEVEKEEVEKEDLCPQGEHFDTVAGKCVPWSQADCEETQSKMWKDLLAVGRQYPIAHPDTYTKLNDMNILSLFAGDQDLNRSVAMVDQAAKETQKLFRKLVTCDGSGCDGGHAAIAQQLVTRLEANTRIFNFSIKIIFDRSIRSMNRKMHKASEILWNSPILFGPWGTKSFAQMNGGAVGSVPQLDMKYWKMDPLPNRGIAPILSIGRKMDQIDCVYGKGSDLREGWVRWQSLAGIKE